MTQLEDKYIKEAVRENYGRLAQRASSATAGDCGTVCCGGDSDLDSVLPLYSDGLTHGLPTEAVAASAGCGNPHAIGTLRPGETVVDFGSGGGIDCFIAAKAVGEEGRVVGIDMTEDMIDLARANAKKLGVSHVEFHLAEMESTPLEDDFADAIISNCVINLAPDKDAVFREAFRILRPGGRLMVSDLVKLEETPFEDSDDSASWVACLAGAELKDIYMGRMRVAGFVDVEVVSEAPWEAEDWQYPMSSVNIKAFKPA